MKRIFATVSGVIAANASSTGVASVRRRDATLEHGVARERGERAREAGALGRTPRPARDPRRARAACAWSRDASEYAGEIGATGTPTCIAASASSACSTELPLRIASGRVGAEPEVEQRLRERAHAAERVA